MVEPTIEWLGRVPSIWSEPNGGIMHPEEWLKLSHVLYKNRAKTKAKRRARARMRARGFIAHGRRAR